MRSERDPFRTRSSYWGLDYAIEDRRAQAAFEMFRSAFFERNFGSHPLHYLSSQVDCEHQIRADFFGTTPELRRLAKGFVRAVNDNTVSYLEEVLAAVRAGRDTPEFADDLARRLAADDVRLHADGQAALVRIRAIEPRLRAQARRAATVVAALVAVVLASCTAKQDTQPMEAAPPPPPRRPRPRPARPPTAARIGTPHPSRWKPRRPLRTSSPSSWSSPTPGLTLRRMRPRSPCRAMRGPFPCSPRRRWQKPLPGGIPLRLRRARSSSTPRPLSRLPHRRADAARSPCSRRA